MSLRLPARSPIGLDIGTRAVAAVQLARGRGGWRLEAATLVARPAGAEPIPGDEEASRLADILYRQGFSGRRVMVAAPDSRVISGTMDLPPKGSGAPLQQLARAELGRMHRRDASSLEVVCWEVPAPARAMSGTYMMAAACPTQDVELLLDRLERPGLRPQAVDIRACAMARACASILAGTANVSAILDLGEAEAVLSVVKDRAVVYERLMTDAGLSRVRLRVRQDMDLEGELADFIIDSIGLGEAPEEYRGDKAILAQSADLLREHIAGVSQELRTALAYAVHRYPGDVDKVLVHGAGAAIPGLVEAISRELALPITVVTPDRLVACPPAMSALGADPALTAAVGLAMYGEAA
jgi:Tfp pilus assembly PilM family ATPase